MQHRNEVEPWTARPPTLCGGGSYCQLRAYKKLNYMRFFYFLCTLLFCTTAYSQHQIQVVDASNEPLIGVHVVAQAIDFSSITDAYGIVEIPEAPSTTLFSFSYIGYAVQELDIYTLQSNNYTLILKANIAELSSVEVVGRRGDRIESTPVAVDKISAKNIQLTNAQTPADALQNSGQVFVQKSQGGGGSPIVRGFEANRVLLVVDGVRMNNAIYRNGHLQNAITLDNNVMENIEVIHGPGALIYGSDALGGVVQFKTIDPLLSLADSTRIHGKVNSRFSWANTGTDIHAQLNFGHKRWGVITGFSRHIYGDIRTGKNYHDDSSALLLRPHYVERINNQDSILVNNDPYLQKGTAYDQYDIFQKWKFLASDNIHLGLNIQYSTSSDIPRYDRLTEYKGDNLKFAEWYYGPQQRLLTAFSAKFFSPNKLYDKANLVVAYQKIGEDRHKRKLGKNNRSSSLADVDIWTLNLDFDKLLSNNHALIYGVDASHNDVKSAAFDTDINSGEQSFAVDGRYPTGGSQLSGAGAYLAWRWHNTSESLWTEAGVRYAWSTMKSRFENRGAIQWPQSYVDGLEATNKALTGSAGLNWKPTNNWHLRTLVATAFRAPNIDDFTRIREKNGFVTIPNEELEAEYSRNAELSIKWKSTDERWQVNTTAFYTQLKDAIVRQEGTLPDGSDFLLQDGDTLTLLPNVNTDDAWVYGLSAHISWRAFRFLTLESGLSWTKGERNFHQINNAREIVYSTVTPLDHIPPIYGKTSITYTQKNVTLKAVVRYNAAKAIDDYAISNFEYDADNDQWIPDYSGTSDNIQQTPIDESGNFRGSLGWTTINFYSTYQLGKHWQFNLAMENLTDLHYRPFASGVSAAGRNIIMGVGYSF